MQDTIAAPMRSKGGTVQNAVGLDDLADWIARGLLPEIIPTRQQRSLRTAMALMEACRELLLQRALDDLPIETICEAAGTTVGAFYGRFENKHAFFITMQRVQVLHSQQVVAEFTRRHKSEDASLDDLCHEMVVLTVDNFRSNLGVLRASLQHTREGMWRIFKESGDRYRAALTTQLAPHLRHLKPAERRLRVRFAYQTIAGTLVHAALNDPGPLSIDDERLVVELVRVARSYLAATT